MVKHKEVPNPTNPNIERLEVTPTGVRTKILSSNKEDVLLDFFNPKSHEGILKHLSMLVSGNIQRLFIYLPYSIRIICYIMHSKFSECTGQGPGVSSCVLNIVII